MVTWNLGALAAGASGSVDLVVQVASPLADGTVLDNDTYAIDSNETEEGRKKNKIESRQQRQRRAYRDQS